MRLGSLPCLLLWLLLASGCAWFDKTPIEPSPDSSPMIPTTAEVTPPLQIMPTATPPQVACPSFAGIERVQRYVIHDNAPIFETPKVGPAWKRTLSKGTSLMVRIQGEWAEIVPDQYVQRADLSENPPMYSQRTTFGKKRRAQE